MKIFCISIYNENYSFFKKNNLIPVGLGSDSFNSNWINDKFENDISDKNKNFGEYTFHYKLWKNGLLNNDYSDWTGFCSYRRFWVKKNSLVTNIEDLNNAILREVPDEWSQYGCILPEPIKLRKEKTMKLLKNNLKSIFLKPSLLFNKCTIRDHFNLNHGAFFLDEAIKLLEEKEKVKFSKYLEQYEFNPHNLFICKDAHLLKLFYNNIFNWLFKCENIFQKLNLNTYGKKRIYGFLAERYLPFWFKNNTKTLSLSLIHI